MATIDVQFYSRHNSKCSYQLCSVFILGHFLLLLLLFMFFMIVSVSIQNRNPCFCYQNVLLFGTAFVLWKRDKRKSLIGHIVWLPRDHWSKPPLCNTSVSTKSITYSFIRIDCSRMASTIQTCATCDHNIIFCNYLTRARLIHFDDVIAFLFYRFVFTSIFYLWFLFIIISFVNTMLRWHFCSRQEWKERKKTF